MRNLYFLVPPDMVAPFAIYEIARNLEENPGNIYIKYFPQPGWQQSDILVVFCTESIGTDFKAKEIIEYFQKEDKTTIGISLKELKCPLDFIFDYNFLMEHGKSAPVVQFLRNTAFNLVGEVDKIDQIDKSESLAKIKKEIYESSDSKIEEEIEKNIQRKHSTGMISHSPTPKPSMSAALFATNKEKTSDTTKKIQSIVKAPVKTQPTPASSSNIQQFKAKKAKSKAGSKARSMSKMKKTKDLTLLKSEIEEPFESAKAFDEQPLFLEEKPITKEPKQYKKFMSVEYFDKMNPEKYYPLILNISDIEQQKIKTIENVLTGERKTQKKDTMEVELEKPYIVIRPIFPGCVVTPSEQLADFDELDQSFTFYITPIVKDDIKGRIDFLTQEGQHLHSIDLPAKVDDPRYAKTIAAYGTFASILPKILPFFGIDIGSDTSMSALIPLLTGAMGGIILTNFIAYIGIFITLVIGVFVYISRKPNAVKLDFKLGDLREKIESVIN